MSLVERILVVLSQVRSICDDCLAERAQWSRRQIAYSYCSKLAKEGRISRQKNASCSVCGRRKLANTLSKVAGVRQQLPDAEPGRSSHEAVLREFLARVLEKHGRGQFRFGGRPSWDGRVLDDTIIVRDGRVVAAVELEARTDKQVRGALWDLIEYGAPISVLVWASEGYGSAEGPQMVRKWIKGLEKEMGVIGRKILSRFVVLVDSMSEDDPEVRRLFQLLGQAAAKRVE